MPPRQRRKAGLPTSTRPGAEILYRDGLGALDRGDTEGALRLIGRAAALEPGNSALQDNLGTLLQMLNRLEEAETAHRRAIALRPDFAEAHYNLGNALQRLDRKKAAAEAFSRALAIRPFYPEALNNLGSILSSAAKAEACYRQALAQRPDFPEALNNLGTILRQQGRADEAKNCYDRALAIRPGSAEAVAGLAEIAQHRGEGAEAEALCRALLRLRPQSTTALLNLGNALRLQNRLDEAEECYRRALAIQPDDIDCLNNLGAILHRRGRGREAGEYFSRVIVLSPDHAEAHNNLGNTLQMQGKLAAALESYRRAIALKPDYAEAYSNLGCALQIGGDLQGAAKAYHHALGLKNTLPDAHSNLGTLYSLEARMGEAALCFEKALELRPDYPEALNNLGNVLQWDDRVEEGIDAYERAIALRPGFAGAHMNLGMALLAIGQYRRGWREYEWRWQSEQLAHARRSFAQPQWLGEAAPGRTILLHAEQGFGDTLQFCRFAPLVAERGLKVVLEVQKPLVRLLESLPGLSAVIAHGDELPPFDLHCPLLSLPAALDLDLDGIPASPYLKAPPDAAAAWGERIGLAASGRLKVGLVWAGSARTQSQDLAAVDRRRSITWETLEPLLDCPGIRFFCLQKDGPRPSPSSGLIDFMAEAGDFADTAAMVENLDLLISVDTAMVHLAGGLGRPVWVLNRFDSCWRWLRDRDDSPWYQSARLFRQPRAGDWGTVLGRVGATLARAAASGENLICGPAGGLQALSAHISTEDLFAAAIAHHGQGRLSEAIKLYRQVITRRPDEVSAYLNIGQAQMALGLTATAAETFRWVAVLRPDCPEAHAGLGCALDAQGKHHQALAAFSRALSLRPDYTEALNNRGKTLCALDRDVEAIADFSRAVELDPGSPQARHNLAAARRNSSMAQ